MSRIIKFTAEDLLASKILEPGLYKYRVKSIEDGVASTDQSHNDVVNCVVVDGPTQKDGSSPVGVKVPIFFNEKAMGFNGSDRFLTAFLAPGVKLLPNEPYDLDQTIGRDFLGYTENRLDKNQTMRNTIRDFRSV